MNILVVNGYVRQNKGDAALMSVLCTELQKTFPEATIKIASQENPQTQSHFEQWQNIGSFIQYCFDARTGKLSHLLRLGICSGAILLLPTLPRTFLKGAIRLLPQPLRRQFSELAKADLVVSMGGGYLNGDRSRMADASVFLMLAPLKLAKLFGACAVCAPQSMGPFATKFQVKIVKRTLERVNLLLTREKKTTTLLRALSVRFPLVQSVDSGFLFTANTTTHLRRQLKVKDNQLLIGVTVRRWLDPIRQYRYEQAVAGAVDYLVNHYRAIVVFIPQVTSDLGGDDDRVISRSVYKQIEHKKQVHLLEQHYTHQEIKSIYNELDLIIGTRFHSVIFSLTSLVPALAIEYEHKTSGIMHDLGLDKWVVKIEEATAELLTEKIDQLVAAKDQYRQALITTLPVYTAKAQQATFLTKQAYEALASTRTHDHVIEVNQ